MVHRFTIDSIALVAGAGAMVTVLAACTSRAPAISGHHNPEGISPVVAAATVSPVSPEIAKLGPSPTPAPARIPASPTPSVAPTSTGTPTQAATDTPTASATPSDTPTATRTPTAKPRRPTSTPTLTPSPTPAMDFKLVSWRLWPLALNGGCEKGMHVIFVVVQDGTGAPLDGVVVGDTWNNVEVVSGNKGPGRTEIDLWANTMEVTVKRDQASGKPYSSQASPPCASFITTIPDDQLVQAGYFSNELEAQWNRQNNGYHCGGHYSWEVVFQRSW